MEYGDVQKIALNRCLMIDAPRTTIPPSLWLSAEEDNLPPLYAQQAGGECHIIAGHEVWYAAQLAGKSNVPAVINIGDTGRLSYEQDPVTEAKALEILKETHGLTDEALAESLRWSRKRVADFRRLLRLHPEVQAHVQKGRLGYAVALELVSIPENRQCAIARHAVELDWSLADVRERARRWKTRRNVSAANEPLLPSTVEVPMPAESRDPNVRQIERTLSDTFGCQVRLGTEQGVLVIAYKDLEVLDGLLERWSVLTI